MGATKWKLGNHSRALCLMTYQSKRAAQLLHSFAHSQQAIVPGGNLKRSWLEAHSIVNYFQPNLRRLVVQMHFYLFGLSVNDGIAQRFPRRRQQIPIHMTLPADPVQSVRIPIVIRLQPGAYKVAWRIADQIAPGDGSSSFAVQLPDGSDPAPPALHHHH